MSNIVDVFMNFWTELRGVKRVTARGDITVFRGTFKFDNFYFINQANFSLFSHFKLHAPRVHRSVPPNVHLGTVQLDIYWIVDFYLKVPSRFHSHSIISLFLSLSLSQSLLHTLFFSLSDTAKHLAPCIVFIDEIDSLAAKRNSGPYSPPYLNQSINQLLTELDG